MTQVAVAWVLGTVFLRFCEDNGLIEYPFITGPGERADLARDLQAEYFQKHPEQTDRDWNIAGFDAMSLSPVAKGLFDRRHNPMWTIQPSHYAAKALLAFWRETGPTARCVYDLTDPEWNTRFLGDLYQDLSETAREDLRPPPDPGVRRRVHPQVHAGPRDRGVRPYAHPAPRPRGSAAPPARDRPGLRQWPLPTRRIPQTARGLGRAEAKRRQVGVDSRGSRLCPRRRQEPVRGSDREVPPDAGRDARRGVERLSDLVDFPLNIAVGDSLLHGKGAPGRQVEFDFGGETITHSYRTEDVEDFIKTVHILEIGTYHVAVGNPPYITVKDKAENEKLP